MKNQIDYQKLLKNLKSVEALLPTLRPEEAIGKIKNLDSRAFDELIRECRDFQESVERAVEDCQSAVQSPIYIGVVGHFSHGKSSLLNALLFPPRTSEVLPTGEGVVTSMCTLLQFSNTTDDHEFYEVNHSGDETYLPINEYRARVGGQGSGKAGTTSHFKVRLQIDKLSDPLFKDFAEKQIELLDTPGLGGPYWKDEAALHAWMKEFVLIVICVKSTEINESTAASINPFLKYTTKPLIPVITFWDLWKDSPDFKGIVDEEKARAQAKRLLSQYFPLMARESDETIFASAKGCFDATEVPDASKRYFTEDWNIDNVRRKLSHYVTEKGDILRPGKSKESTLDAQRRTQVRQLVERLCADSARFSKNLRGQIKLSLPKGQNDLLIQELQEDFQKEIDHEVERLTSQIDRQFSKAVPLIEDAKSWGAECARIKDEIELTYKEKTKESVSRLATWFGRFKQTKIDPAVKESGLKDVERQRLEGELKRYTEDLNRYTANMHASEGIIEIPNTSFKLASNLFQALGKGFRQLLISNLPLAIGLALALPVIALIRDIPWLGEKITGGMLFLIVFFYGTTVLGVFWSQFQHALKLSVYQAREKTLQANSPGKIAARINSGMQQVMLDFIANVTQSIETRISPLDEGTKIVLDDLTHNLDQLENSIRDVRQLI